VTLLYGGVETAAQQTTQVIDRWRLHVDTALTTVSHAKGCTDTPTQVTLPAFEVELAAQGEKLVSLRSGDKTQDCDPPASEEARRSCDALAELVSIATRLSTASTKITVDIAGSSLAVLTGGCPLKNMTLDCDLQHQCRGSVATTSMLLTMSAPGAFDFTSECHQKREAGTITVEQAPASQSEAPVSVTIISKTTGRLAKSSPI
jgi:hypothetical protein